ncbi:MAG: hypothetical protein L0Y73_09645, partial [Candidatus Aminicenantes bacterium]|nr:hypothetical protein [Candidatus Aminicenantes bacterium]
LYSGSNSATPLKLKKAIDTIADKDLELFVGIRSVAVDKKGNFYIYDYKHGKIIKLNAAFDYVSSWGRKGEGPGDFKALGPTFDFISIGLDNRVYFVDIMKKKIMKYTLEGNFIDEYRFEQSKPFKVAVDEHGDLYLPSMGDFYIDVHDNQMKFKKSLLAEFEEAYLFFNPPPCAITHDQVKSFLNLPYDILSDGNIVVLNQTDISIMVIDRKKGTIQKMFHAWDDYILAEYKKKLSYNYDLIGKDKITCSQARAFSTLFLDNCPNIYLSFVDSHGETYIYQFSVDGKLVEVYHVIQPELDDYFLFFHFNDNNFYAYGRYGIYIFGCANN